MSVRLNIHMSKIIRTLIKVGIRTYATHANCRTLLMVIKIIGLVININFWNSIKDEFDRLFFKNLLHCFSLKTRIHDCYSKNIINTFVPNTPFLYPLKASENRKVLTNGLTYNKINKLLLPLKSSEKRRWESGGIEAN